MSRILSQHDIPAQVRENGKIVLSWQPCDFTKLRMLSRLGWGVEQIAKNLNCLFYFRQDLVGEILEQSIERDPLVRRCLHPNFESGTHSPLDDGETDEVLSQVELLEYQDVFSSLRNTLLELPKQEFERILGVLLEELTAVKTPKPTAAAKPTRATLSTSDRPKRRAGGGQNRCSEPEINRRILQLCRSLKGESLAQIGKIVSPLQNRAKESNQTLKECILQRVRGLAAQGLGEVLGEGKNTRFRSFEIDVRNLVQQQSPSTGLQAVRDLCCVA